MILLPMNMYSRKAISAPLLFCGRLSTFWKFQLALWLTYTIGSFPIHYHVMSLSSVWEPTLGKIVAYQAMSMVSSILLTAGLREAYRRMDRANWASLILQVLAFAAIASVFKVKIIDPWLYQCVSAIDFGQITWRQRLFTHWYHWCLYTGWSLCYFFARAYVASRQKALRLKQAEEAERDAEIRMLRAQVTPHFLFNSMNTILSEAEGNPKVEQLTLALSDYFRYSLSQRDNAFVTLDEELAATSHYLDVQKIRYGDELEVEFDISPECRELPIPGVFLQPLAENAVKYGRDTSELPLKIKISAHCEEKTLLLTVSNTGSWQIPQPRSFSSSHSGNGLENIRRRLNLLYPGSHQFQIQQEEGCVVARIVIENPWVPFAQDRRSFSGRT